MIDLDGDTVDTINFDTIIKDLEGKSNDDLLFMASIIRLMLDERKVWYPSRESVHTKE